MMPSPKGKDARKGWVAAIKASDTVGVDMPIGPRQFGTVKKVTPTGRMTVKMQDGKELRFSASGMAKGGAMLSKDGFKPYVSPVDEAFGTGASDGPDNKGNEPQVTPSNPNVPAMPDMKAKAKDYAPEPREWKNKPPGTDPRCYRDSGDIAVGSKVLYIPNKGDEGIPATVTGYVQPYWAKCSMWVIEHGRGKKKVQEWAFTTSLAPRS